MACEWGSRRLCGKPVVLSVSVELLPSDPAFPTAEFQDLPCSSRRVGEVVPLYSENINKFLLPP